MKKTLLMIIAFAVMGMTAAAPVVQAQTQQQQQELEQIARRSMNGLSPQDRQRTIQIMTDVFVGQGMSRQQAATLAEMSADSMFSSDVGEMSAEERRMFEEQNQAVGDYEQRQQQPPQQAQTLQLPGANTGWPSTAVLGKYTASLRNLNQPARTTASYSDEGINLTIYLQGGSGALADMKRQLTAIAKEVATEQTGNDDNWKPIMEEVYHLQNTAQQDARGANGARATVKQNADGTVEISIWQPVG